MCRNSNRAVSSNGYGPSLLIKLDVCFGFGYYITMKKVYILPEVEGKGRTFSANCLAYIEADSLWDNGSSEDIRPVWSVFANSENELRPFITNLTLGKKAVFESSGYRRKAEKLALLKSVKYRSLVQKETEGNICTLFLADLFRLDPGFVDPNYAKFLIIPTKEWCLAQNIKSRPILDHIESIYKPEVLASLDLDFDYLIPMSYLFCAYLDRRIRCPLVSEGRFYLQVLLACLDNRLASFPDGNYYHRKFGENFSNFKTYGLDDLGFTSGIAFSADHVSIEELLSQQVELYYKTVR